MTRHIEDPWAPADERQLDTFKDQYIIVATCTCGHVREIHVHTLLRRLGAAVTIGQARDRMRCHLCQVRRPAILVLRMPR